MPNLRGPLEAKRKLYGNVIQSIVMYGAPIWGEKLIKVKSLQRPLRRIQRTVATRIVARYRTISYDIAYILLARTPPWPLLSEKYRKNYWRIKECMLNGTLTREIEKQIRKEEDDAILRNGKTRSMGIPP